MTAQAKLDRTLIVTRLLQAPRSLVWKTFSTPYHLAQWWGPEGFGNPVCEVDFRVGGIWHDVMRGPDGVDHPLDFTYLEVVPEERIVYRNAVIEDGDWGDEAVPPSFIQEITLTEEAGGTRLTIRAIFDTVAEKQFSADVGFSQGTNSSLDKLERHLATLR